MSFSRPLIAPDIARTALFMLEQPLNVSIKALDVVPSGTCLHDTISRDRTG